MHSLARVSINNSDKQMKIAVCQCWSAPGIMLWLLKQNWVNDDLRLSWLQNTLKRIVKALFYIYHGRLICTINLAVLPIFQLELRRMSSVRGFQFDGNLPVIFNSLFRLILLRTIYLVHWKSLNILKTLLIQRLLWQHHNYILVYCKSSFPRSRLIMNTYLLMTILTVCVV